jgi:hypothetical protein
MRWIVCLEMYSSVWTGIHHMLFLVCFIDPVLFVHNIQRISSVSMLGISDPAKLAVLFKVSISPI